MSPIPNVLSSASKLLVCDHSMAMLDPTSRQINVVLGLPRRKVRRIGSDPVIVCYRPNVGAQVEVRISSDRTKVADR